MRAEGPGALAPSTEAGGAEAAGAAGGAEQQVGLRTQARRYKAQGHEGAKGGRGMSGRSGRGAGVAEGRKGQEEHEGRGNREHKVLNNSPQNEPQHSSVQCVTW